MLRAYLAILIFVVFTTSASMDYSDMEKWDNPEILCEIKPSEEPVRQIPYDKSFKATNYDLQSFCESMRRTFANSNLSKKEAHAIYVSLFKNKLYRNDASYGMPYKGAKNKSITLESYKERTAIKRLSKNKIAVYFYWTGCGTNFEYYECKIENKVISDIKQVKSWSASAPC